LIARRVADQQFDLFVPYISDLPLRDQRETMERPFFSLAKRKLLKPIEYDRICKSERRGFRQGVPEHRVRNDYDMGRRCLDLGRL
jgi:hypothetical protein